MQETEQQEKRYDRLIPFLMAKFRSSLTKSRQHSLSPNKSFKNLRNTPVLNEDPIYFDRNIKIVFQNFPLSI
ncbi:unnamed protein product [Paramecium sonneborni]|uniref:Uncharacterized protein n=1 Tax=Paramecium sonneborni TaxID=65129 RepID=A0A8S1QPA1_9CILI|nr:unnamed protein product [Paramecium sonneborni]